MATSTVYEGAIKKFKSAKSSLTGSAAIFTCIFLLNLSQVSAEGQRCYVCGPRSSQWYSNGIPPPCSEFKPEPQYEVVCGKGYDYCAIIKTPGSQEISRLCVETHEPRGCISKACAKTKTLFSVCSCNGTLCNGEPSSTTVAPDISTQGITSTEKVQDSQEINTTTMKTEVETTTPKTEIQEKAEVKSHENVEEVVEAKIEEKTANTDEHEPKIAEVENPPTERPIKHEHENAIQNDEVHLNKTRDVKKQRDVANNAVEHKQETVTTHALPLPEALGQEHKKNNPHQGAPVDDEEDAVEGSGSRIEEQKPHNPTTHMSQTQTTTTEKPSNSSATTLHITLAISFWTMVMLMVIS